MLRFSARPTGGRADFELRVKTLREAAEALGTVGDWKGVADFLKANAAWGEGVKEHFAERQHRKCGYCERLLTDHGDVEHYRPKTAIFTLLKPGRERQSLNNTAGRSFGKPPKVGTWDSGYWWLAYSWDNYLVSCGLCNQSWKNALFPVAGGRAARPAPGDEAVEDPLLLDPFGRHDPAQHLEFLGGGAVRPLAGSEHGAETIRVCGLDRPSVVASRLEKAARVERKLAQLNEVLGLGLADPELRGRLLPILEDLFDLGDERFVHAGMARAMFVQGTGWTWEQLEAWLVP
ncbi:MAG: hypothetical protein AMXMBFR64_07830 [Myxococcales bacterium]